METVLRGASVYVVLLLIMRFSGRRSLAQSTPFDFVLLLIIAETTQQALLGDDFSIANAVVLIVTLSVVDLLFAQIKQRLPRIGLILDGAPTVLLVDGKPDAHALQRSRVSVEDILQSARGEGIERVDQIKFAILEQSGTISIIPKR